MSEPLSLEDALLVLADPTNPAWGEAFELLASHPETAELILDTFRETLAEMGVAPAGRDPVTGEPTYSLRDVSRALGIPEADLHDADGERDPTPT